MLLNHVLLACFWIFYCVLHSVLASTSVKRMIQRRLGSRYKYYRIFYTLFAFVFLIAVLYFQIDLVSIQLINLSTTTLVLGILISFSGVIIMSICIWKYFMRLSGLRSMFTENTQAVLMITGIHRHVRHPLYLGTFIFIWGLFLLLPYLSLLIANTIITIYTLIGIELEERKLSAEFGDSYSAYKSKVPKLLPLFKPRQDI